MCSVSRIIKLNRTGSYYFSLSPLHSVFKISHDFVIFFWYRKWQKESGCSLANSIMTKRIYEAEKSASRRKNILYAYKNFFLRVQKNRPLYTMKIAWCRNESRLPQKVTLCHNEVNTKVSFCQKARLEGIPNHSRTKPEVFPMYHNVSISCFAFSRSVRL